MKKLLSIFLILFVASFESCTPEVQPKTELEKLPPITQQGKDTFGCLVNSKAWVTRTTTDALAFYQSGLLQVSAGIHEDERQQGMTIIVSNGITEGLSYELSNDPQNEVKFSSKLSSGLCFYEDNTLSGYIKITKLDQVNLIISGLFEFSTVVPGCDTIKVTDGRFDLHYAS